jgi:AcrR family transcriptional regulator
MPRPSSKEIQSKIRTALVGEVAEKGIGGVAMGPVAKRSGVSPGTLYLHYENKEDMLQKVYLQIKAEFHGIMVAAREETDSARMIRRMWVDMFDYVSAKPHDFLFIEYAGADQVLSADQAKAVAAKQTEINDMLRRAIDDGTLAPLPVATIVVLLVAPAMHLARTSLLNGKQATPEELSLTFDRVWLSIANASPPHR